MAQRQERNVKYFPHSANHRKTLIILEDTYPAGYKMWFKTLEQLAITDDHYLDVRNEIDFLFLASQFREEPGTLEAFYNLCAKLKAIDQELWEQRIIWSENFIENIRDAYKRRANKPPTKKEIAEYLGIKIRTVNPEKTRKPVKNPPFIKFDHLQISEEEYQKLTTKYGKAQTDDIILQIKNYRQNTKYKSLYLTAGTWLKKRVEDPLPSKTTQTANEKLMERLTKIQ